MTSSLVGSEMCIRDRKNSVLGMCSLPAMCSLKGVASVLGLRRPSTRRTVSYTHLTLPTICSV
eukprot:3072219-Prorocentrum_lima.AAC.1